MVEAHADLDTPNYIRLIYNAEYMDEVFRILARGEIIANVLKLLI
jgi:hypothetical protein